MPGRLRVDEITSPTNDAVSAPSGMKFSNVANPDPHTLDWYEEGVWNPTISWSTTPGTWGNSTSSGAFVRVGRQVSLQAIIIIGSTWVAGTGYMRIYPPTSSLMSLISVQLYDDSASVYYPGILNSYFGSIVNAATPMNTWSASLPVALGYNDQIIINGSYIIP